MSGYYFSHDYAARSDDKIKALIRRHGMAGYGVYWAIVEDLYQNGNRMRADIEGIAYDLRVECDIVRGVLHDFDLFVHEADKFGSASIGRRLEQREAKSINARKSALSRWGDANAMRPHSIRNANASEIDANALREECDRNAIKGKERKEKERKEENKRESTRATFVAPSLAEVVAFAETDGIGSTKAPQDFHDYYTSNGWKVGGRGAMKDWRAAFRRWTRNEKTFENATHKQAPLRGLSARTQSDWDALQEWGSPERLEQARVRLFGSSREPEA